MWWRAPETPEGRRGHPTWGPESASIRREVGATATKQSTNFDWQCTDNSTSRDTLPGSEITSRFTRGSAKSTDLNTVGFHNLPQISPCFERCWWYLIRHWAMNCDGNRWTWMWDSQEARAQECRLWVFFLNIGSCGLHTLHEAFWGWEMDQLSV